MEPPRLVIYDHDPSPDRFRLGWRHVQLHGLWWRPSEVASAFEGLFAKFPDPGLPFGELRRPWVFMSIDASPAKIRSTAEIPLAITLARIARCGQTRLALAGLSERVENCVRRSRPQGHRDRPSGSEADRPATSDRCCPWPSA